MEKDLIKNRRDTLEGELARLNARISNINAELNELDVAESVLARLSGKKTQPNKLSGDPKPNSQKSKYTERHSKPEGLPTIRELVLEALMDARQRGLQGLAPREIKKYVIEQYNYNMGASANTIPSRMWHLTKELNKDLETGLFSIPEKIEPVDNSQESSSTGSLFSTFQRDRKADQGGGA
ncbi:MAG: hypothetical protein ABJL18_11240 [Hyphomicrobiales bacterium]